LSPLLSNLALGTSPVLLLRDLKKALEKDSVDKDADLTPEEVVQRNFKEKLNEWKKAGSIVDDLSASRDDLKETIEMLKSRLKRLRETEIAEKMNLSELKDRVKADLKKAEANLRQHKE
jgi:DNA repair ATPase RecN